MAAGEAGDGDAGGLLGVEPGLEFGFPELREVDVLPRGGVGGGDVVGGRGGDFAVDVDVGAVEGEGAVGVEVAVDVLGGSVDDEGAVAEDAVVHGGEEAGVVGVAVAVVDFGEADVEADLVLGASEVADGDHAQPVFADGFAGDGVVAAGELDVVENGGGGVEAALVELCVGAVGAGLGDGLGADGLGDEAGALEGGCGEGV